MPGPDDHAWRDHDAPAAAQGTGLVSAALAACARALEAETDRWFLWLPVLFAGGIVAYFSLSTEPSAAAAAALVIAAVGLTVTLRKAPLGLAVGGAACALAFGFATAKLRTEIVRAPVLPHETRYADVTGWVEARELRDKKRVRLTLRVLSIDKLEPGETPYRVRITMSRKQAGGVATGEAIAVKATLLPPPEPVQPGAFDFGRAAWFDRLGATGYATGRIEVLRDVPERPWDLALWAAIDRLRTLVNARIRAVLSGEAGEIAVALITGERGGIPKEATQAMRDAGLAHILAISGLHMVIVAGTVFWLARALLALVPGLALRFPIRKWAAVIALAAATFYLGLSGAAVPTVRAWIMMSIVLLAVMLDRPALTMRNVALAALAILILSPESLFHPSFQMSFAAVVALVALFEWVSNRERDRAGDVSPVWRGLRYGFFVLGGTALTTLAASFAIAPFAVYHFHRMTHFGLAANLIVTPLITLLVMPMALLSLIAMPFGLEAWPLHVMGVGIELMVATGTWVSSWPGAVSILPTISGAALVVTALGGLWLCLWQTHWRALGLVIAAVGILLASSGQLPDVLVERDGATAALRSDDGLLAFPTAAAGGYSAEKWLLADGDERNLADATATSSFRCDLQGCIGKVNGKTVAFVRHPSALEEDCRIADIVIVAFSVGRRCRSARVVVDRRMLWSEGAHALYFEGLSIRTESVAQTRGRRPWVPDRARR